jgi:two-component system, NarL family, response regulator
MTKQITILIVDDHLMFRVGIRSVLTTQPDLQVVAEAKNYVEALEAYRLYKPDLVILDLRMPGRGGLDILLDIHKIRSDAKTLILSSFANEEEIYQTIKAGANGYLLKDVGGDELISGIHQIFRGQTCLSAEMRALIAERRSMPDLTPREVEILKLIVKGLTNRELAAVFGTSQNTIRNQTISIFAKLEVTDRAEAAGAALQRGIVIPNM